MGSTLKQILFGLITLFIIDFTSAKCVHIPNDDMQEYNCDGGSPADLLSIPDTTEKIRITRMSIPRLTAGLFSRFGPNLWVLSCSYCEIEQIDDDAFQSLENLQQLSLDDNKLRTVRAAWFRGLEYLTYLDLNHNQIENIEPGVFEHTPHLVDLRISGNRLQCLNIGELKHLQQLKRVFLTENPEFKCPNAVTRYLETQGILVEKDPSWNSITQDLVPVPAYDKPYQRPTTTEPPVPVYRERLHLQPYETSTNYPETTTPRQYYPRPQYYPTTTDSWTTTTESDMININHRRTEYSSEIPDEYDRPYDENSEEDYRRWEMEHSTPQAPPSVPIEMIHPAVPEDFYQGPYYAPKVTTHTQIPHQQPVENYRQPSDVSTTQTKEEQRPTESTRHQGSASTAAVNRGFSAMQLVNVHAILIGLCVVVGVRNLRL